MTKSQGMRLAELVARAGAKMVREYVAEMRKQGKIKGKLFIVINDGKKQRRFPFRET